jgi:hypothetical protein
VVALARRNIEPRRYECLGCAECYPALALNALGAAIRDCANRNPGVAEPFAGSRITAPIAGSVPERMRRFDAGASSDDRRPMPWNAVGRPAPAANIRAAVTSQ